MVGNPDRNIGRASFGLSLALTVLSALTLVGGLLGNECCAATDQAVIRVGCELEYFPYDFVDAQGQPAGFGIDLIKAVAREMGLPLVFSSGAWNTQWDALVAGQLDVMTIVAKTPSRVGLVGFSLPHTETFDAFFVRKADPQIPDFAAARGKSIVVARSGMAHHALLERKFEGNLVLVNTVSEGLLLVSSGQHDAFLGSLMSSSLDIKKHHIANI